MISLAIYILSFVIIIGVIASITTFFNNNIRNLSNTVSISSEYNKFNLYFLKYTKNGYSDEILNPQGTSVRFFAGAGSDKFTYIDTTKTLYFNKVKLCENVDEFKVEETQSSKGDKVLKTLIKINGETYTTEYVLE